jgi:hypothetical protein
MNGFEWHAKLCCVAAVGPLPNGPSSHLLPSLINWIEPEFFVFVLIFKRGGGVD